MGDFRTFQNSRRQPAQPMSPVIDPAGWAPADVANVEDWAYVLDDRQIGELIDSVRATLRNKLSLVTLRREDFPLPTLAAVLADMRMELLDGRGMVMLRGFPVTQLSREEQVAAYLGLGAHLGRLVTQNAEGHVLGHVTDLGADKNDPNTRGYITNDQIAFHTDSTDFVGLLCLQTARSGGESRVSNSVSIYNRMLAARPDLAEALIADFYYTLHGERNEGEPNWYRQPVFSFNEGYFSACGYSAYVLKAQGIPGVPPLTEKQREALPVYRQLAEECAVDMGFEQGDIQFLNNHVLLHSRRAYQDWPEKGRKRHLLRLWLNDPVGRPIPEYRRQGRHGGGVLLKGVTPNVPFDV